MSNFRSVKDHAKAPKTKPGILFILPRGSKVTNLTLHLNLLKCLKFKKHNNGILTSGFIVRTVETSTMTVNEKARSFRKFSCLHSTETRI